MMKKITLVLLCIVSISSLHAQLFINEVLSSNNSTIQDEAGEYDDWIEIYNSGSTPVDLEGYYLTDKPDNPEKFQIVGSLIIPQNGYVLIWADEDGSQGNNHANFKLSSGGEFVMLTDPNGVTVIDSITVPELGSNQSYGRTPDGNPALNIMFPASPGASNNASNGLTLAPTISRASGHYNNAQTVSISAEANATIYFTTDGSIPTTSSQVYTGPISISSTSSLRAIAQKPGFNVSFVVTNSYLINFNTDLPIFFITMNPDDLYDDQVGIYVEGTNGLTAYCEPTPKNYNQDWEREGHLKVFVDGNVVTENNIGVNIGGNCKRQKPQKPLNLRFRDEYSDTGDNEFNYKIFPDNDLDEFKRLFLRDGNNDIRQLFKDAAIARLLRPEFDLDVTSAQPAIVFFNGDYIGIQVVREKWDRWHLSNDHDKVQDRDSIDMIRNPGRVHGDAFWAIERAADGDTESWHEFLIDVRSRDMSIESDYQGLKDQIDYNELINYLTTGHFFGNRDWIPNNQRVWKEKGEGRKWRWALTDFDSAIRDNFNFNNLEGRIFRFPNGDPNDGSNILYRQMFEHQEFRHEYIQRMNTYMQLVFTDTKYGAVVDGLYNEILPDLPMANQLYGHTLSQYTSEIASQKSWIAQRAPFVRQHMEDQWNLSSNTYNLSLNFNASSNGRVALHSNYFEVPANYQGTYHDNILIDIHAIPNQGYRFSHWQETGNTNAHLYTSFTTNTTLTPVFVPAQDLVINEIHYNPNGSSEATEFVEIYNPDANAKPLHFFEFGEGICFEFPEGTTIGPGEYVVIANDASVYQGNGYQVFEFEFSNLDNDGEHLSLINRNNQVIDSLTYNDGGDWIGVADGGFYSLALLDHTLDNALAAAWDVQSVYITPGAPNQFLPFDTYHAPSDVVINEIHYHPFQTITSSGDTISSRNFEFIELKNLTSSPVSLTGVALSRGITYEFPIGAVLPANGFIVLAEDSLEYINRYGQSPYGTYSGKLSNSGEMIWLSNQTGQLLDAVRYDDVFPWDNQADGGLNDFSLALIDPSLPNDTHINWRRQCTALHTPGQENDFGCFEGQEADGLIINEIDYNPNEASGIEFVELFNNSFVPINLEGLLISDAITYQFPSGQLLPGQYYIIARDSALFENTYNVAVDGSFSGGLSSQGETILISDFFGNTVDIVSYDVTPPWTNEPAQGIKSLALIDPDLNNNNGFNWCVQQSDRTPKAANDFADTDNDGVVDCIDSCPALDNDLIGTACDDGDPCTPTSIYTTNCNCEAVENVALAGTASMSSQFGSLVASNLNDDLVFIGNSQLAHTGGSSPNEWFEIDLGSDMQISSVVLWNRINCCSSRINNVYIMVADTPFPANTDLTQSLNNSDYTHQLGDETGSAIITVNPNASGRYVRIQKSGNNDGGNFMNLRELQVFTPVAIVDTDNDGDCDIIDQCPNFDNNLIGQSCDDNDPCTTGDVYTSNCACEGTVVGDADNDSICDTIDQCPNFDDTLIGTTCDDNDPCTTNDLYTNTCDCVGTVVGDSDGDGLCNAIDVCPNFDDNLIGTACDDNDPCTTNDLYTNTCDCVGTAAGDSDGDGVCNAIDQCPNFDDNLIGTPCDDGIICFVGSTWDANCNCSGGAFSDLDNDNVCDPLDQCPGSDDNVDVNNNGIPDGCEGCQDYVIENGNSIISSDRSANINITTNGRIFIGDIDYHAGQDIDLIPGFEVKAGAVFHAYIAPCN